MDWYLYLDCLYLIEESRGLGIGKQLMKQLKDFATKIK
ncbi:GNAT family N-acetyltransferase [Pseudoalteromonas sp. '520P1 No. 423']